MRAHLAVESFHLGQRLLEPPRCRTPCDLVQPDAPVCRDILLELPDETGYVLAVLPGITNVLPIDGQLVAGGAHTRLVFLCLVDEFAQLVLGTDRRLEIVCVVDRETFRRYLFQRNLVAVTIPRKIYVVALVGSVHPPHAIFSRLRANERFLVTAVVLRDRLEGGVGQLLHQVGNERIRIPDAVIADAVDDDNAGGTLLQRLDAGEWIRFQYLRAEKRLDEQGRQECHEQPSDDEQHPDRDAP